MKTYFLKEVSSIIHQYKRMLKVPSNEPFDGDDVDAMLEHIRNTAQLNEGNITRDEYLAQERFLARLPVGDGVDAFVNRIRRLR